MAHASFERQIALLQSTQQDLIAIFDKHLAQQMSRGQLFLWLTQHINPLFSAIDGQKDNVPGLWLIDETDQAIRSYISDIEKLMYPRDTAANVEWYWETIREYYDYLTGRTRFKVTRAQQEGESDGEEEWMMACATTIENYVRSFPIDQPADHVLEDLTRLKMVLGKKPRKLWTLREALMEEMIEAVQTDKVLAHYSATRTSSGVIIDQLVNMFEAYQGRRSYSVTATFEGVDEFSLAFDFG